MKLGGWLAIAVIVALIVCWLGVFPRRGMMGGGAGGGQ
jgi:hypothetical protein